MTRAGKGTEGGARTTRQLERTPLDDASPRDGCGTPPGLAIDRLRVPTAVISCNEAAAARGVPLAQELKTLVLRTTNGMVAAHLPGDAILSLRKVKRRLAAAEACLADPHDLWSLGLAAGTVSAVLDPVWSMPHLVSVRLLQMPTVTTNDGTLLGYFAFDPQILTGAAEVLLGEFES